MINILSEQKINLIIKKQDWVSALKNVDSYDFYHTYDYHHLSKGDNEKPILLEYIEDDKIIIIPFLLRKVFDTNYYDLTSVYGYSGPLMKNIGTTFDNSKFNAALELFYKNYGIVAVFSRLHPFFENQKNVLNAIGEIKQLGRVVNVDLTKSLSDQRMEFSKTTKRYLTKTRKVCLVKSEISDQTINVFKDLYYENMDRVNAQKLYYFSKDYLVSFLNSEDFDAEILFAVLQETNEIISGAIMVKTNDIIQYHISGTRNKYLHLTPIRMLIDEMRIQGTEQRYTFFNLGGGLGSAEDSLFNFKASFSKNYKFFEIWKHVVNPFVYSDLVNVYADKSSNQDFFPLYRNSVN